MNDFVKYLKKTLKLVEARIANPRHGITSSADLQSVPEHCTMLARICNPCLEVF